ncbi:MAG: nicotinamidase [Vicinamibacterales bacterium]|jgi:nicotinamidase/pyrazinamidase|nr:nicotinamidase [Vicinamibacterales bacterium]
MIGPPQPPATPDDGTSTAVLVVDVQRDFCPGGALAVADGDRVVPVLNRILDAAHTRGCPVYATRDWHPPDSRHFLAGGGSWPVHCVAGSRGAQFHPDLRLPDGTEIVSTGTEADSDGYSAFEGTLDDGTPLAEDLRRRGITHMVAGGLATDYCVRHSVLDAIRGGWRVTLVTDAIAAVDLKPGDGAHALEEMRTAGAELCRSADLEFL